MRLGLGIHLTKMSGGGDRTAPIITNEVYTSGVSDTLTADVSEPGTYWGLWSASSSLTNAAVKSGATVTGSYTYGPNTFTVDDSSLTAGTWYLHILLEDAAGNQARTTTQSQVVAAGKTETFSAYTSGNGYTELSANGYSRSNSIFVPSITTNASGVPTAQACQIGVSSNNFYYMNRSDVNTYLAARVAEDVEVLVKFKLTTTATSMRAGIGHQGSSLNTGLYVHRFGANNNAFGIQVAGDVSTPTNNTLMASSLADNGVYWVRMKVSGDTLYAKYWTGTLGNEGGSYTHSKVNPAGAGINITFNNVSLIGRVASNALEIQGYSTAYGAAAPGF